MAQINLNTLEMIVNSPGQPGSVADFNANGGNLGSMTAVVNGVTLKTNGLATEFLAGDGQYRIPTGGPATVMQNTAFGNDVNEEDYVNYSNTASTNQLLMPIDSAVDLANTAPFKGAFVGIQPYTTTAPYQTLIEMDAPVAQIFSPGDIIALDSQNFTSRRIIGLYAQVLDVITTGSPTGVVIPYNSVGQMTGTGTVQKMNSFSFDPNLQNNFKIVNLPVGNNNTVNGGLGPAGSFDQVNIVADNENECILTRNSEPFIQNHSRFVNVLTDSSGDNKYTGIARVVSYPSATQIKIYRYYLGDNTNVDPVSGTYQFTVFTPVAIHQASQSIDCIIDFGIIFDGASLTHNLSDIGIRLYYTPNIDTSPFFAVDFPVVNNTLNINGIKNIGGSTLFNIAPNGAFYISQFALAPQNIRTYSPYLRIYGVK